MMFVFFFFQAEDGIRDVAVTGVQTCALPISDNEERGAPRNHRGEEELRQEQRALPEVAPPRLPEEEGAVARRRPGEDEGGEGQEGDDLAAAQERAPEPQEGDAAVGDENPRAPDQPGSVVRPDEDVVEALGALEVEHEEGRRREKEEERQGRRGDAEQRDRRQATAEHRDRRDQERAGGDRFREEIRRDPPPPRPRR